GVVGIDVNDIRASDNFFDLGGDSLLVLRAVQQTELLLGYRVEPRRYLFENLGQIAASSTFHPVHTAGPDSIPSELQGLPAAATPPRGGLLGRALGGWLRKG